jgi:hypothetical protein
LYGDSSPQWVERFGWKLPCGDCRRKFQGELKEHPPDLSSHESAFAWTVDLHNKVNDHLGKKQVNYDDALRLWSEGDASAEQKPAKAEGTQWRRNRAAPRPESIETNPPPAPSELSRLFDAAWCVNLDFDSDRWDELQRQLAACDWPFCPVKRLAAVHGDTVGVPDHFHQGGGAWGCLQSHRRVLELRLMAGHQRILVMEDDADQPWDCLMLGGQHMATPKPLKPGVVRAANIQRTHCMAFSRPFMRALYRFWSGPLDQHCDWALGPFAAQYKTFAPQRFIVGQRGGTSRIRGDVKPPEWWNPPPADAPVVWLRCPRAVLETCRDVFHAGNRRNHDGVCIGLADVFDSTKNPTQAAKIAALGNWIAMIQWEVESRGDKSVCAIWHPAASASVIRGLSGVTPIEIVGGSRQEVLMQWSPGEIVPGQ